MCRRLCGGLHRVPIHRNQQAVAANAVRKQENIDRLVAQGKAEFGDQGYAYLTYAYDEYLGGTVERYGLEATAEMYDITKAADITNVRTIKINYCRLMLNTEPLTSRLFGLSYDEMTYHGYCYDVENDFHGIAYLYGWAGLACLLAFLGYFLVIIVCALIRNARRYFTVEAGACGIALCTALAHIYNTAGVLRRPNASLSLPDSGIHLVPDLYQRLRRLKGELICPKKTLPARAARADAAEVSDDPSDPAAADGHPILLDGPARYEQHDHIAAALRRIRRCVRARVCDLVAQKVYGIAIAACAFLLVGHCISCFIVGYQRIVYDLTNFVRVVQMPLFVLCFISFLRANNKCYRAFETGLMLNFWIITASVVVSVLTHTSSATYQSTNVGILGWYSFGNAQSAIMSILAPIVILLCYRRKNFLLFTVTSVAALAQLYLMGTRLAFFSIAVAALGVPVVLVLTGKARTSKRYIAVLVLILIACCATYKQSPMYINQNRYNEAMSYKQNDAERMIKRAEGNKTGTSTVTPEERYHALCTIYNFYSPNMCQRFGTARVMSAYGYSDQVTDITATRHRKIVFCEMLLDEQPFTSRLFGMELGRMAFDGEIYDVENDFHGICFLYGWVGLAMMVAFIGYFLYLIVKCLIKDFRKYFTVEAGAFGIGLCLCLVYAYFTAGVLRRPNASIYMSVLLAVVYYLTQMRSEQPDALPDGEEKRA